MAADSETHDQGSMISRRKLLVCASTVGAATFCPLGCRPAFAAVQGDHSFKLGAFDITVVSDGTFTLPLSFALPTTARADLDALYQANGQTFDVLQGQMNVTVVKTPDAVIVIDCGGGGDFMPTMGQFADNLERMGLVSDTVTHVVFTHAHADHLWGVIDPLDDGSRFPKARHMITGVEFDHWMTPDIETTVPDAMKGVTIGSVRRLKTLAERLERVKAGAEIVPGVVLFDTAGHTPGHISVLLKSGAEQLLIGGDVVTNPIVSFAKPAWPWGPDNDQSMAATTRQRTLDMLVTDKVQLLGYHLPWPGVGRVEKKDGAFRFVLNT
jgi:glyoxylase-like metal-dependent hydrolase (beta-lactamase superfamily II)